MAVYPLFILSLPSPADNLFTSWLYKLVYLNKSTSYYLSCTFSKFIDSYEIENTAGLISYPGLKYWISDCGDYLLELVVLRIFCNCMSSSSFSYFENNIVYSAYDSYSKI